MGVSVVAQPLPTLGGRTAGAVSTRPHRWPRAPICFVTKRPAAGQGWSRPAASSMALLLSCRTGGAEVGSTALSLDDLLDQDVAVPRMTREFLNHVQVDETQADPVPVPQVLVIQRRRRGNLP